MRLHILLATLSCFAISRTHGHLDSYSISSIGGHDYGSHGSQNFNNAGHGLLKHDHQSHGEKHHGLDDEHDEKKHHHHTEHEEGSHGAVSQQGGHKGAVKQYHDKGSYSKEKKFGYEKSYGYEKESKHHNKGGHSHTYGDNYNHHKHFGHHNRGEHGAIAHNLRKKLNHFGSEKHGDRGHYLNKKYNHHSGKKDHGEWYKDYSKDFKSDGLDGYGHGFHSSPIGRYQSYRNNYYPKWKYVGGLHSIGGMRNYGLGLGFGSDLDGLDGFDHHDSLDGDIDGHFIDNIGDSYGNLGNHENYNVEERGYYNSDFQGITGLGGGLGPRGHYYYVKHHKQSSS